MSVNEDWIEYRRQSDGERVGWILPRHEGFIAIDLLGSKRTGPIKWMDAEQYLEELGLAYLAEPYELEKESGEWVPVRLVSVSADDIEMKTEDYGAVDAPVTTYTVPFPKPDRLRARG